MEINTIQPFVKKGHSDILFRQWHCWITKWSHTHNIPSVTFPDTEDRKGLLRSKRNGRRVLGSLFPRYRCLQFSEMESSGDWLCNNVNTSWQRA